MALQNFKPEVWSAKFMDDLDKTLVFKENCNHSYEGDAKKAGDSVRILGLGDIATGHWGDGKLHELPDPQEVSGNSIAMPINQIEYFNFQIDDLDKAQAQGGSGLLAKYQAKAKDRVAEVMDSFIAKLHVDKCLKYDPQKKITLDGANGTLAILDAIEEAYVELLEQNISRNTKVTLTAPPKFIMMLKRAYVELDTNNSEMMRNGRVGRYSGIELKESNNVYKVGTKYHIQLKTDEALAFVNPYTHMEGDRPSKFFTDVVKGYTLYDGLCVAPKQCVDMIVEL